MRESLRHIVGVQFRNCATVGGSIYGRFGFSDVLTMFLGMDSYVELFHGGRIPLTEFVNMKKDNDILVNMIIKKVPLTVCYLSQRNTKTDFPVLTCTASLINGCPRTVIGARPARAMVVEDTQGLLSGFDTMNREEKIQSIHGFAEYAAKSVPVSSNMRASQEYRSLLVQVLTRRAWETVGGVSDEN